MPTGGMLRVVVSDEPETAEVLIEVTDTGTGISPQNMERMFEPFFTTKESGQGTGLGLPIIYGIVKMHRGNIRVESNDDPARGETGTTFQVSIPRQNVDVGEPKEHQSSN